ncbi:hypothetical protein SAMN05428995_11031 [Loktanella sp. DSM 29012]|nr:hypothetical protein SAMN05428995_11031 [Loktanella sp. DSM 29012]
MTAIAADRSIWPGLPHVCSTATDGTTKVRPMSLSGCAGKLAEPWI